MIVAHTEIGIIVKRSVERKKKEKKKERKKKKEKTGSIKVNFSELLATLSHAGFLISRCSRV